MDSGKAFDLLLAYRLKAKIARVRGQVVKRRRDQNLPAWAKAAIRAARITAFPK